MSNLSEKVAFLKGLAEGMKLSEDTSEHKLLLKLIETLEEVAQELDDIRDDLEDLNDYVEEIDEDLEDIEDLLGDDDEEDEDGCAFCGGHDDEEDDLEGSVVEYECPHCGYMTRFDVADFDLEEDYRCPSCHQPLFPETEEEEDDDEDDAEDDNE